MQRGTKCVARNLHWGGGGCFGSWKQQHTILTQILIGVHSDRVVFYVQIQVISKKKGLHWSSGDPKKKALHWNWDVFSVQILGDLRKKRSSSRLKLTILHDFTSSSHRQYHWGGLFSARAPPPPPPPPPASTGYATASNYWKLIIKWKYFTLLIPVGYCSLLRKNIPVQILYSTMVPVSNQL